MIIGLGNDLINIDRIEKTLTRFGERFTKRVFTDDEILRSESRKKSVLSLMQKDLQQKKQQQKLLEQG